MNITIRTIRERIEVTEKILYKKIFELNNSDKRCNCGGSSPYSFLNTLGPSAFSTSIFCLNCGGRVGLE